jgi:hypothetical protein
VEGIAATAIGAAEIAETAGPASLISIFGCTDTLMNFPVKPGIKESVFSGSFPRLTAILRDFAHAESSQIDQETNDWSSCVPRSRL